MNIRKAIKASGLSTPCYVQFHLCDIKGISRHLGCNTVMESLVMWDGNKLCFHEKEFFTPEDEVLSWRVRKLTTEAAEISGLKSPEVIDIYVLGRKNTKDISETLAVPRWHMHYNPESLTDRQCSKANIRIDDPSSGSETDVLMIIGGKGLSEYETIADELKDAGRKNPVTTVRQALERLLYRGLVYKEHARVLPSMSITKWWLTDSGKAEYKKLSGYEPVPNKAEQFKTEYGSCACGLCVEAMALAINGGSEGKAESSPGMMPGTGRILIKENGADALTLHYIGSIAPEKIATVLDMLNEEGDLYIITANTPVREHVLEEAEKWLSGRSPDQRHGVLCATAKDIITSGPAFKEAFKGLQILKRCHEMNTRR